MGKCGLRQGDGVIYTGGTRLANICRQALEEVVFSKNKHGFSLSHTKIVWCEKSSLKAWLPFYLISVAHIPLKPTPCFFPISCLKQVFHPDTKHFTPCSLSLPLSVFTPFFISHPSQKSRKTRLCQSGFRPSSLKVPLSAHVCVCARTR